MLLSVDASGVSFSVNSFEFSERAPTFVWVEKFLHICYTDIGTCVVE